MVDKGSLALKIEYAENVNQTNKIKTSIVFAALRDLRGRATFYNSYLLIAYLFPSVIPFHLSVRNGSAGKPCLLNRFASPG